ncbi:MAG TPA: Xaa-Pro peptidase family protein [Gemmatimonadales bacterium]|jgi:Xaa-Pro dipeptidase
MTIDRRTFGQQALGIVAGAAIVPSTIRSNPARADQQDPADIPVAIRALRPMLDGVVPITAAERGERIERARRLMRDNGFDAILIEPGTTLGYFTTARWSLSERSFLFVLPARGEPAWVAPGFEEERSREQVGAGADLRLWQEDESPYRLVAGILRDRGIATGRLGIESRVRFFVADGVRQEAGGVTLANADPVTVGCRMIKSPNEIALMQRASDITMAAFRATFTTLHEGMTQTELSRNMSMAQSRLGGAGTSALVALGASSAFPHGSVQPQHLREGDVVLVDAGCSVEGYESDITRTTVFGRASQRQRDVWDVERRAQTAALAAARIGAPCESVDAAARKVITDAGFGPDYRVPGLPHRTGHGIGMDGHEAPNLVRGNTLPMQAGMCFSDEPTIAIYGEFGIRLEDCFYMTPEGGRFFSAQSPAIDQPLA